MNFVCLQISGTFWQGRSLVIFCSVCFEDSVLSEMYVSVETYESAFSASCLESVLKELFCIIMFKQMFLFFFTVQIPRMFHHKIPFTHLHLGTPADSFDIL